MWMATRSDSMSSMMSCHAINFQSLSSSEMIPMGRSGSLLGMNMISNNVTNSGLVQTGNSSNSSLDSVSGGLKLDTSLASEWSTEEQIKLEVGLEK